MNSGLANCENAWSQTAWSKARGKASRVVTGALGLGLALSAPAFAQSMLGAPGLSPVAPDAPAAPSALAAPPAGESAGGSSCDLDMEKFQKQRNGAVENINQLMKGGKGKKLDPIAACPRFRNLVAVESQMKAWMLKNKDWCSIPDQIIESMKTGFSRTPVIANQACTAAAQVGKMKKMQGQQRAAAPAAPAVKLPAGPL